MSVEAMLWVFRQDIRPSSAKFVLLALADNASPFGDDYIAWPSIACLSDKTSQDRKTVIESLGLLVQMGLIADTGERRGSTKQVKVYRLVGMPTSRTHYVYRLTETPTGEFYIGVRSCDCDPAEDPYMGSGKWTRTKRELYKEVLEILPTRAEANAREIQLIRRSSFDPLCQNIAGMNSPESGTVPKPEQFRSSAQTVPNAVHGTQRESKDIERRVPTTEPAIRIAKLYNRALTRPWSEKEVKAFKKIGPIDLDDLAMVEAYTLAQRKLGGNGIHRRDLQTFLNNFLTELDRAREWQANPKLHEHSKKTTSSGSSDRNAGTCNDGAAKAYAGFSRTHAS